MLPTRMTAGERTAYPRVLGGQPRRDAREGGLSSR